MHDLNFSFLTTSNSVALILLPLFHPQIEYKYDKEMMKGCVIPVVDDKLTLLAMKNNEMASTVSFSHVFIPISMMKWIY